MYGRILSSRTPSDQLTLNWNNWTQTTQKGTSFYSSIKSVALGLWFELLQEHVGLKLHADNSASSFFKRPYIVFPIATAWKYDFAAVEWMKRRHDRFTIIDVQYFILPAIDV